MLSIVNHPSLISVNDVTLWISYFFDFIKWKGIECFHSKFDENSLIDSLTVEFSDEIPPREFINEEEAKKELIELFSLYDLPHIDTYSLRDLAGYIKNEAQRKEFQDKYHKTYDEIVSEVNSVLSNSVETGGRKTSDTLGQYTHCDKKITLFNKAIEDDSNCSHRSLKDTYLKVFIHEMFHAFHYAISNDRKPTSNEIISRHDLTSKVIKETLASYFEHNYCLFNGIKSEEENAWKRNTLISYPYAGAQYIADFSMFNNILIISFDDMDLALRTLLKKDYSGRVFYDIKNAKEVRRIITKVTPIKKRSSKNHDKYLYKGIEYGKGKLVLAVIKDFINCDTVGHNVIDLKNIFTKSKIKNRYEIVEDINKIESKDLGIGGVKRYFTDTPIVLKTGETVLVTNQWGRDNINTFIDYVNTFLPSKITYLK